MIKLPNLPFLTQENIPQETLLALIFLDKEVKAIVWQVKKGKMEILGEAQQSFEGEGEEERISACDSAISVLEEKNPSLKINKVIFGLSEQDMIDNKQSLLLRNKISPTALSFLKKLCSELELKPAGFVVVNEAIVNLLKTEEGAPPTVLLINFSAGNLSCALVKSGKIEAVQRQKEVEDVCSTLSLIFSEFKAEILPSRVILYNGKSLEQTRQELISYPWQAKASFLHFPKFEVLPEGKDLRAIVLAASHELAGGQISWEEEEGEAKTELPPQEKTEASDLGFVKDRDILEVSPKEDFGQEEYLTEEVEEKIVREELKPEKSTKHISIIEILKTGKNNFFYSLSQISLPKMAFPPIVIIIIIIIALVSYWTIPKASVTLVVTPKTIEKESEIKVFPSGETGDLPVKTVTVKEEITGKTSSTGKKITGEKARGKVTIYSKTENAKIFDKGIVLFGGNLKFTLDKEVTVASTSAFSTSLSSVSADITAAQIGTESNLSSGSNFTFKDFPVNLFFAKNEQALTGGTSREVKAISKEDQNKLFSDLSDKLLEKAKSDWPIKLEAGQKILEETIKSEVRQKKYSHEPGAEVAEFSLDLSRDFSVLTFSEKELLTLLAKNIEEPSGLVLKPENLFYRLKVKETKKDGGVILLASSSAKLLPEINMEKVKKELGGKSLSEGKKYLLNLPSVSDAIFDFRPKLPSLLTSFPRLSRNITLQIVSQ